MKYEQSLKVIKAICSKWSVTKGVTEVATLGAKYNLSFSSVYRIWAKNKELCK